MIQFYHWVHHVRWHLFFCAAFFFIFQLKARSQVLVWEENFDGTTINPNNWTFDFGDGCERGVCGWGNNELEYYTSRPENARVENGNLVIEARRETFGSKPFTSARLKTFGRVQFKYGTLEARIKVPNLANGLWPAFWMLGTTGTWPASGEVDMMEMGSAAAIRDNVINKRVGAAVHWENSNAQADYSKSYDSPVNLTDDYHIYKLTWDSQFIRVYIDGTEYFAFDISGASAADLEEFHQQQYILLNLAVGGNYTGIPTQDGVTAPMPGQMLVDYIRLYQNPGDELYLGKDHAPEGNYGVYTENPAITNKLVYGQDANLYIWNNLANIAGASPFEGNEVLALRAAAANWFGMGVATQPKNMSNYANGFLNFNFKSTYAGQFKVGISSGFGDTWINFPAGATQYGLVRDGQWHQVSIPLSAFQQPNQGMNLDLGSITQMFMFSGDAPSATADFYIDNIYYGGGVAANPAPTVSLTSPAPDALFSTNSNISLSADAADANGSVAKVEFYNGPNLLGTVSAAPYNFTWTNVPAGVYNLTAKATDNEGTVTTSKAVAVFVAAPDNKAPVINITSPAATSSFTTPATINIQADATDADGSIYKVDFYNGSTLLGTDYTAPYTFTMSGVTPGVYNLTAVAMDNGKLTATSAVVSVTVKDNAVTGGNLGVFTDNASIPNKLVFGQDANFYIWNNLSNIPNPAPYEGPNVWAFSAAAGNWFGGGVANDIKNLSYFAKGSLRLQFKTTYNGEFKIGIKSNNGESWIDFPAGTTKYGLVRDGQWHQLQIPISDFANLDLTTVNQAFMFAGDAPAANAEFYLDNIYYSATPVNKLPVVSLTAPADQATFTAPVNITLSANASDPDGAITKVDFYNGDVLLGTDNTAPYSFTWNGVAAGTYTITAKATDDSNAVVASAPVKITVSSAPTGGPNLALNKPVTVSSVENPGTPGSAAVDGNTGTRWSSAFSDPQWIMVDLGAIYNIGEVKITWEPAYAKNYQVQVSTDGTSWTTVKDIVNNTVLVNDHTGLTATGRCVRVYGTVRALPYGYSIYELEVYGSAASAWCGTAANGDYSYKAVTEGDHVNFTFHPLGAVAGGNLAIIYIREGNAGGYPGYTMTKADNGDFTFTRPIASGTPLSIYFTYQVGSGGGERNSSATPHSYVVGTDCGAPANVAPSITITSPSANAGYTSPASITINATASDADGSITKVEFFNGNTSLGSTTTSPYSFTWSNVAAGNYTLTAKATDNSGKVTTSDPVSVVVSDAGQSGGDGYCGTAGNGDYSYKAVTSGGNVTFTFHPLSPITGSNMAIVYPKPAAQDGPPPGYGMTRNANGDFTYTITGQTTGTVLSFYFTYAVPSGGERNSSANPHRYTVGSNCSAPAPEITLAAPASVTAPSGAGNCSAVVNNIDPMITPATADAPVSFTLSGATSGTGKGTASGQVFNKGVTTVTYTLVNEPSKTASFTVTVEDKTAPVPDLGSLPDVTGSCSAAVSSAPTATDNCAGKITATTTDPLSYSSQGNYSITWVYNDGNGNSSTQVQHVVVKDNSAPVVVAPQPGKLCYNASGYTITKLTATDDCGIGAISYTITGVTQRTGTGADASGDFNAGTSTINWTVQDVNGNVSTAQTTVVVNPEIKVSVNDTWALSKGVDPNTAYIGYAPASSLTLQSTGSGGSASLSYQWSNGYTGASVTITPNVAGTYNYTVTASDGTCQQTASKTITAVDIRCGNKNDKVQVCQVPPGNPSNAKTNCVDANAVAALLSKGSYLGSCTNASITSMVNGNITETDKANTLQVRAIPNPSYTSFNVIISSADNNDKVLIRVYNTLGQVVEVKSVSGNQTFQLGSAYRPGVYYLEITQGKQKQTMKLIKQAN